MFCFVFVAKNLVLAGVGSLTLMDEKVCDANDLGTQFFITDEHVRARLTRAQASLEPLRQLNPYVKLSDAATSLSAWLIDSDTDERLALAAFDCVVLTDAATLDECVRVNASCRRHQVKFVMSDVFGLFAWCFVDLGDEFVVHDANGEEHRDEYIGRIDRQQQQQVHIEVVNKRMHHLESGDLVRLSELTAMPELNDRVFVARVINSHTFSIEAEHLPQAQTQNGSGSGGGGGSFRKMKRQETLHFGALDEQLARPDLTMCDLSEAKFNHVHLVHCLLRALLSLPPSFALEELCESGERILAEYCATNGVQIDDDVKKKSTLRHLARMLYVAKREAKFAPLCAILGGVVAQEALKALTGKFTPIKQWLHLDCSELSELSADAPVDELDGTLEEGGEAADRYRSLRRCLGGSSTLEKLQALRVFMVGCGAIGCELLKNYALLGVACGPSGGLLTITDNDLIEKSNLNRQFLFRQHDIQKSKASVAAAAVRRINERINVRAMEHKVCAQTEADHFPDAFFGAQDICVNALDNLEARRYMVKLNTSQFRFSLLYFTSKIQSNSLKNNIFSVVRLLHSS